MYTRTQFPRDFFAEFDRLHRAMQQFGDWTPNIRGDGRGGFPAINVGSTPNAIEIYIFVPGVDPAGIDLQLEKGVLSISGERKLDYSAHDAKSNLHVDERFAGRFHRVVTLPDDADPEAVTAACQDGVLHVSVARKAAARSRRISIQ